MALLSGLAMGAILFSLLVAPGFITAVIVMIALMLYYFNLQNKGEIKAGEIPLLKIVGIALLIMFIVNFYFLQ